MKYENTVRLFEDKKPIAGKISMHTNHPFFDGHEYIVKHDELNSMLIFQKPGLDYRGKIHYFNTAGKTFRTQFYHMDIPTGIFPIEVDDMTVIINLKTPVL